MKLVVCAWFLSGIISTCMGYSLEDPCENHNEITSNSLQVTIHHAEWYRFVNTTSGLLATSCPEEDESSNPNGVIWTNETQANMDENSTVDTTLCIKVKGKCCPRQIMIQMKYCPGYAIYHLVPSPRQAQYCFNNTESLFLFTTEPDQTIETTIPVQTQSSSTLLSTKPTQLPSSNSKDTSYLSSTLFIITIAVSILLL